MTADFDANQIDLAREEDFRLGDILVRPSTRQVETGGIAQTLQPRIMQVLVALARRRGQVVSRDELIRTCWEGRVVGEDAINRCIHEIRKLGETSHAFEIETIPRVGYRLKAADGAISGAAAETPPTHFALGRRWLIAVAAGLVLAGGLAAWWINLNSSVVTVTAMTPTVAVLPFDTLGDDGLQAFSRSLVDQVTSVMTQSELQTPGPSYSSMTRKEQLEEAARAGAQFVLDGVVEKDGNDLRVNVRLMDPRAKRVLWAKEYRRAADQHVRFAYQVASHSVDILRCALVTRPPKAGAIPPQTLTLFLNACDRVQRFEGGGPEMSAAAREVTRNAPEFSFGWSMLAMAVAQSIGGPSDPEGAAKRKEVNDAADRALQLDPANGESYVARALLLPLIGHWGERQQLLDKAISVQPDFSDAYAWKADNFLEFGRMKDARDHSLRAVEMDRLAPNHWAGLVQAYMANAQFSQAQELREKLFNDWPDSPAVVNVRFANAMFSGDPAQALKVMGQLPAGALSTPFLQAWMRFQRARQSGRSGELDAAVKAIDDLTRANIDAIGAAMIAHSATGELDTAFDLLELLVMQHDRSSAWFLFLPMTTPLRADPRIVSVFERLGYVDYWRSTGKWPDFCDANTGEVKAKAVCEKMMGYQPR